MSKYTPGPWEVEGGSDFFNILDSGGEWVAQLWDKYEEEFKPHEESEANAWLIAFAPEMLEILQNISHAGGRVDIGDYEAIERIIRITM